MEPLEPLPPRHGVDEEWSLEPKPVCPQCDGLLRRWVIDEGESVLRCDLHGVVEPAWYFPDEEETE